MKTLEVSLDYRSSEHSLPGPQGEAAAATPFPFRVVDGKGALLAEGAVNGRRSARIEFEDPSENSVLFVRLLWPTGKASTREANYGHGSGAAVHFSDENSPDAIWARWAAPRVPAAQSVVASTSRGNHIAGGIDRFKNVWLRLWSYSSSNWSLAEKMPRVTSEGNETARQIDLQLAPGSHLLQLGGTQMPWTFVSLPGGGPCRIFLTPNPVADAKNLPLKVVVTSFRPEAETIAEFLSRDALRSADSLARFVPVATKLLEEKFEDAISAIAGAYYLLRVGRWRETPISWFNNLYEFFPWSADAALIRCVLTLRKGLRSGDDVLSALRQLQEGFDRGVPLFEEGHRIRIEAYSLLRGLLVPSEAEQPGLSVAQPDEYTPLLNACQSFAAARAWTGPSFSYFGVTPARPSARQHRGAAPDLEPEAGAATLADPAAPTASKMSAIETAGNSKRRTRASSITYLKDL